MAAVILLALSTLHPPLKRFVPHCFAAHIIGRCCKIHRVVHVNDPGNRLHGKGINRDYKFLTQYNQDSAKLCQTNIKIL